MSRWKDLTKVSESVLLTQSPNPTPVKLSFDFPFNGNYWKEVSISAFGNIQLKEEVSSAEDILYISPLECYDLDIFGYNSKVYYYDNGTSLIVQWNRIGMTGSFYGHNTFQAVLQSSGDITFIYKHLWAYSLNDHTDDFSHFGRHIRVGISSLHLIDGLNLKVLPRLHPESAILFEAPKRCNMFELCHRCVKTSDCYWCPSVSLCAQNYQVLDSNINNGTCYSFPASECLDYVPLDVSTSHTTVSTEETEDLKPIENTQATSTPEIPLIGLVNPSLESSSLTLNSDQSGQKSAEIASNRNLLTVNFDTLSSLMLFIAALIVLSSALTILYLSSRSEVSRTIYSGVLSKLKPLTGKPNDRLCELLEN